MSSERLRTEGLPLRLEGKFRLWRYSVSHSELELRSVGSGDEAVNAVFFGVLGMKVKSIYTPLVLQEAEGAVKRDIFRFLGVDNAAGRVIPLLLSDGIDLDKGFVACLSFVVRRHWSAGAVDGSGLPDGDSEVIARS